MVERREKERRAVAAAFVALVLQTKPTPTCVRLLLSPPSPFFPLLNFLPLARSLLSLPSPISLSCGSYAKERDYYSLELSGL